MNHREDQLRLDAIAMRYLAALEHADFSVIEALWSEAERDAEIGEMLHGLNVEWTASRRDESTEAATADVLSMIEKNVPSAEIVRRPEGPLRASDVAEYLRKHPPHGLTADEMMLNEALRSSVEVMPAELGVGAVVAWGRRFGAAPEAYWKAFRATALLLKAQRETVDQYQMAARPRKPETKP